VLSFTIAGCLGLFAQSSSLQGSVTDVQGATIPDAGISSVSQEPSLSWRSVSNSLSSYSFAQVPPGTYRVEARKSGFKTVVEQVRLQINTPATLPLKLEVGQVSESINVVAETPAVNTSNPSMGNAFTESEIRQLPLLTRNVVDLLSHNPA